MIELVGGNDNASHKDAQKVHECLSTIYALFVCFCGLVSGGRPGCASTDRTSIMFIVGTRECLIDARFDIALGLATHSGQLSNMNGTKGAGRARFRIAGAGIVNRPGARLARDERGSAAIEFGLVAPAFLVLLLGIFQMGIWMQAYNAMRNAVTETARSVAVEYQTDNKLSDTQIEATGLAVATTNPYLLDSGDIEVEVTNPTTQTFTGARELELTLNYQLPTFLDFAGIEGPEISYSRTIFVLDE